MSDPDVELILDLLHVIETRALDRVSSFYHPELTFHWPPGLPYSGDFAGPALTDMNALFASVWLPLQPTEESRRMDPRVLCAGGDGRVVVHYIWRGEAASGRRFATETLADYQVRNGLLVRAQMFHYDLPGLIAFLAEAGSNPPSQTPDNRRRHTSDGAMEEPCQ